MKEALLATENKDVSKRSPDFRQLKTEIYRSCGLVKTVFVWTGKYDSKTLCVDPYILIYAGKNLRLRVERAKCLVNKMYYTMVLCQYAHPEAETLMVY